jgi:hypothetical protein
MIVNILTAIIAIVVNCIFGIIRLKISHIVLSVDQLTAIGCLNIAINLDRGNMAIN